jgi:Flp pilus assembly protein TadD
MYFSRRQFLNAAAILGAHIATRFRGFALRGSPDMPESPCFLRAGSGFAPFARDLLEKIPPGRDAFVTETYAAELETLLRGWSSSLFLAAADLSKVLDLLPSVLSASLLGKPSKKLMRSDSPVQAERIIFADSVTVSRSDFEQDLAEYFRSLISIEVAEFKMASIKVLDSAPLKVRTNIAYSLVGQIDSVHREQRTGEWELHWQKDASKRWTILQWSALHECRSRLAGPGFVDITPACFGSERSYHEQLQHGIDHWRTILDGACGIDIYGNNGISAGDFNNDGFDDLYVCQPAGLPNRLYRNRGDGTFEDVTEKAGVGVLDATSSAIFADLTNNGLQDLIVVRTNGPLLFVNRGDGTFELKANAFDSARPPQGAFTGVAVADYDRDGLLDVYFALYSYYQGLSEYQFPTPYYDAQNGPPSFLFRNRGDGTFEDVTLSAGLDKSNHRYTLACSWNDYNNDGWPDLYVVNDFGRKVLYKNNGNGTFTDVSLATGVEDPGEGMSATWLDYDNDGFDDLYVVNMWEAAGKRVTMQEQFMPFAPQEVRRVYARDALGNVLLHNDGEKGSFHEVTDESGTRVGGWNWGSDAWDFDNDGYPDLYIANGFISGQKRDDLSSFYWRQIAARSLDAEGKSPGYEDAWTVINECIRSDYTWSGYQRNNFYLNNRNGTFTEAAGVLGLDCLEDSRSFALSDIDGDGRLEIILKNRTAPQIKVLYNQLSPVGLSIGFSLKGTRSNRDAIGAVVELQTPGSRQRKSVRAGSGFLTQHSKLLMFGLGATQTPVRAVVHWPSGSRQVFENLPPGHRIEIAEDNETFKTTPFSPQRAYLPSAYKPPLEDLSAASETWLVEPILPPKLGLPDLSGKVHSLDDVKGQPQLVIFWTAGCDQSEGYLHAVQKARPQWEGSGLRILAIRVDAQGSTSADRSSTISRDLSFSVLLADQQIGSIYSIFYRYLFDRRRDMELPTSFLLNGEGEVVKVYTGPASPTQILADAQSIPVDIPQRLRLALPFPGRYFGGELHRNYFTYGVAFLQYGYVDQAITSFTRVAELNPSHAGAHYNLGLIYLNKDMLDEAKVSLTKTVELDPSNANAWNNLGVVYGDKGEYEEALRNFKHALALQPTHVLAIQNLVKLYEFQGHPAEARMLFEKALSVDPSLAELHVGLAMLLVEQNDLAGARWEFEQSIRLQPENVDGVNGLGVILMKSGDFRSAMDYFVKCQHLDPDFDRAYLNMASLYVGAGDNQKARDVLTEYLARHPENQEVSDALKVINGQK